MRLMLLISLALTLFALIFPVAASWQSASPAPPEGDPAADSDEPPASPAKDPEADPEPPYYTPGIPQPSGYDSAVTVKLLDGGHITDISLRGYLIGAVAAEVPTDFQPEAIRAQAVALRSYLLRKMADGSSRHPEADICSDSSCCAAWKSFDALREKWGGDFDAKYSVIASAVDSTGGMYLSWEGEPALAVFHSSSAGRTESSGELWNSALPYLVSVPSPETEELVPNFVSSVTVSAGDFAETVTESFPDADFSGDPLEWIEDITPSDSGRLGSVTLGGVTVSGSKLRSLFGLRSTAIEFDVAPDTVTMTCRGYGHGVGMSQYGANIMASGGADFRSILESYYPGTELLVMPDPD